MPRRILYVVLALAATVSVTAAGVALAAGSQGGGQLVAAKGKEFWEANGFVAATFRWDPGTILVSSGNLVTFAHGNTGGEPHTVTLARKAQLPTSFDSPCKPCDVASGHLKNPRNENSGVAHWVLNKGAVGFDRVGDSLALAPKGPHSRATIVVSAPVGTTLYYVCAIHPWMQGKIVVSQ